jgi:ribonuclease HI
MHNLPDSLTLYFDGACEPRNPGGWATAGWVIFDDAGKELACGSDVAAPAGSPVATNNHAEYCALGFGLKWLTDHGWRGKLKVRGDSMLICCQVAGKWKCNKAHLVSLRDRCRALLSQVATEWAIAWVPREQNERADALSRQAFEKATGQPFPERKKVAK